MKKLLLILPLFLIFPSLASADISNPVLPSDKFHTKEYMAFTDFVKEQEDSKDTPISEEERAQASATAKVLLDKTLGSFNIVYKKELRMLRNSYEKKFISIHLNARYRLISGEKRIQAWYEKNKQKPNAKKIVTTMTLNLKKDVTRWRAIALKKAAAFYNGQKIKLKKEYQTQLLKTNAIYLKLQQTIAERPSLSV